MFSKRRNDTDILCLGLHTGDRERTLFLLDLIAVLPVYILKRERCQMGSVVAIGTLTAASTWACRALVVNLSIVEAMSPLNCRSMTAAQNVREWRCRKEK